MICEEDGCEMVQLEQKVELMMDSEGHIETHTKFRCPKCCEVAYI